MLPPSRVNVYTNVKSQNSLTPHLIWSISSIWNSSSVVPAGNPLFTRFPAHQTCLVSSPSTAACCQWYPSFEVWKAQTQPLNQFSFSPAITFQWTIQSNDFLCSLYVSPYVCVYVFMYVHIYHYIYILSIHQISLDHFSSLNLRLMDPSAYLISPTEYLPGSSGDVQFLTILSKPTLLSDLSIAENALSPLRKNHGIIFDSLSFTL